MMTHEESCTCEPHENLELCEKIEQNADTKQNIDEQVPLQAEGPSEINRDDAIVIRNNNTRKPLRKTWWKNIYSLFLCLAFLIFGWVYEQMGPAILDLQENTNVTFTHASIYMMSVNIGHIFGSLGSGALYGRVNTYLMLFISIFGTAFVVAVIPWCFTFTPMLIAHLSQGIFGGCLDSVVLTEMLALWGYEAESPMQALYFSFAFGAILSPLCVTPFLRSQEENVSTNDNFTSNLSLHYRTLSSNSSMVVTDNDTSLIHDNFKEGSLLYIPYSISSGLSILVGVLFLGVFLKSVLTNFRMPYVHDEARTSKVNSKTLKIIALVVIGIISALDTALEDAAGDFLTAFCVSHLNWSKQNGALATSLFHGSFAVGRLIGIVEAMFIGPQKLLTCYTSFLVVVGILFLLSAHFMFHIGIWVCSAFVGIALSVVSPSIFTLTEDTFFPVTGRIASYFVIMACIGSALNSFFIGFLMDTYTPLSLTYVILSEGLVIFSLVIVTLLLTRKVKHDMKE